jgi:putative membrane protein
MNGGWGGGFMMIFWVVLTAVIIYWLVHTANRNNNQPSSPSESAIDILKKRYARGEISKEEFEERKKDLL